MKEQLPKQVYTDEFRAQAVVLVTRDGPGIAAAARRLSMSLQTLANWVTRAKGGQLPPLAPERSIQRTPLRISRSARRVLPRVWTIGS